MTKRRDGRTPPTVYSTGEGRVCPRCGWPANDCRCSSQLEEAVPARIVATVMVLQRWFGLSDREAVQAFEFDARPHFVRNVGNGRADAGAQP